MELKFASGGFVRSMGYANGGNSLGSEWLQKPIVSAI
jgi:hypothetical protein